MRRRSNQIKRLAQIFNSRVIGQGIIHALALLFPLTIHHNGVAQDYDIQEAADEETEGAKNNDLVTYWSCNKSG